MTLCDVRSDPGHCVRYPDRTGQARSLVVRSADIYCTSDFQLATYRAHRTPNSKAQANQRVVRVRLRPLLVRCLQLQRSNPAVAALLG